MPVYIIQPGAHLVRANSRAQALRFIAEKTFKAEVAKGETVADLMRAGVKCEDARAPETAELPLQPAEPSVAFTGDTNAAVGPPPVNGGAQEETLAAKIARQGSYESSIDTVIIEGIDHVF